MSANVGESTLAEMHAQEIIRKGTAPDGTERAPMRIAEAHATLGVMAARRGDLDGALSSGNAAIHGPRRSLPTLLMVASELSNEMAHVSSTAAATHNFRDQLRALAHSAKPLAFAIAKVALGLQLSGPVSGFGSHNSPG